MLSCFPVVREFVRESVDAGMDVFRVFDALNWTANMKVAMESVNRFGGICDCNRDKLG